jgi:hypothetical protein
MYIASPSRSTWPTRIDAEALVEPNLRVQSEVVTADVDGSTVPNAVIPAVLPAQPVASSSLALATDIVTVTLDEAPSDAPVAAARQHAKHPKANRARRLRGVGRAMEISA